MIYMFLFLFIFFVGGGVTEGGLYSVCAQGTAAS